MVSFLWGHNIFSNPILSLPCIVIFFLYLSVPLAMRAACERPDEAHTAWPARMLASCTDDGVTRRGRHCASRWRAPCGVARAPTLQLTTRTTARSTHARAVSMTVARASNMQPKIVQLSEVDNTGSERVDAWPSSTLMDMAGHKVGGTSAGKTAITKE